MKTVLTIGLLCGMCVGSSMPRVWAGEARDGQWASVAVDAAGGRRFTGEVDQRSDEQALWVCRRHGLSAIVRPIDWGSIVAVELAGRRYSGQEFRSAFRTALGHVSQGTESAETGGATLRLVGAPESRTAAAGRMDIDYRRVGAVPGPADPIVPIQWLEIEVRVANWDADVEADGVLVRIRPRDAEGALVRVDGTLTVDLVGKEKSAVSRARDFLNLGRAAQAVRSGDFGIDGATYRIPFQARNPIFDTNLAASGLVHAELTVPGQGVVDASDCTVQFRPYSALRDELWQATGSRYWPVERHSPGGR